MKEIEKELLDLKSAISEDKGKKSKLEGVVESLEKRLKDDYGFASEKEALKRIPQMKKELEKGEEEIELDFQKLKTIYEW